MNKKIYYKGALFGNWEVLNPYTVSLNKSLCKCLLCKKNYLVRRTHLKSGASTKCLECYTKDKKVNPPGLKHGMRNTKVYKTWKGIRGRVFNPQGRDKIHYKGITMSKSWTEDFMNFFNDMGHPPKDGKRYSIGRIDNTKGYCKENCRWETDTQQANNTKRTHWITHKGKTMSMKKWADELGLSYYVIRSRINYGWKIDDVFYKPIKK